MVTKACNIMGWEREREKGVGSELRGSLEFSSSQFRDFVVWLLYT